MSNLATLARMQAMYQSTARDGESPLAFLYRLHITRAVRAMGC